MNISDEYKTTVWNGNSFNHRGICPEGWRMPNNEDWADLMSKAGGTSGTWVSGTALKAKSGWSSGNGNDNYEFSALPGGYYDGSTFGSVGSIGIWWSATPAFSAANANSYFMNSSSEVLSSLFSKVWGQSVRCAAYAQEKYTVNVNSEGADGATVSGDYEPGATVTINAGTALEGWKFLRWTVVSGGVTLSGANNNEKTFTMPANDVTVKAVYVTTHTVVMEGVGEGASGAGLHWGEDTVAITAGAAPVDKKFKMWTSQSEGVIFINAYSETTAFVMPGHDVTVTPTYYDETFKDTRNGTTHTYGVVTINDRKWMTENLNYQPIKGSSWCNDNKDSNCVKYGKLYDWTSAMGIDESYASDTWTGFDFPHQGICPDGWHLPNKGEFESLVAFAGGASLAGGQLKSKSGWLNNGNGTDNFGFSAHPGGQKQSSTNVSFSNAGNYGIWWSSTGAGDAVAYVVQMLYANSAASVNSANKKFGFSVRCAAYLQEKFTVAVNGDGVDPTGGGEYAPGVKVAISAGTAPAGKWFANWTTQSVGVVFEDAYSAATAFTMPGGSSVTVTANFGQKYRVNITDAGENAEGGGEYVVGGLVTLKAGTAPAGKKFKMWKTTSEGVTFAFDYDATTTFIMPGHDVTVSAEFGESFTDGRDGKTYRWVSIGNQRWMAENINFDPQEGDGSRCYGNSEENCAKTGRLYNWATAMGLNASYNSSTWVDDGNTVQGVCPSGWHLPKIDEWNELITSAGGLSAAGNNLKAVSGWEKSSYGNGIDAYGFSAIPAGYFNASGVFSGSEGSEFWWIATTATGPDGISTARAYNINNSVSSLNQSGYGKSSGYSVRCVATNKLQVTKPEFTKPVDFVYNGKVQSAGIAENDHYIVIDGEGRNAGAYTAKVVLRDTLTYEWNDGTIKDLEFEWEIEKAEPRPFVRPAAVPAVYSEGLLLEDVLLPEGYAWADSEKETVLEETDDGRSFAATYDDPNGNYHTAHGYITVKYVTDAERMYKVVVLNGGEGASEVMEYAKDATVTVSAGTNPQGFPFRKWTTPSDGVTFEEESNATTTFTMPEHDVTVTANFIMKFEDGRDGTTYGMVDIGRQRWMSENLNYATAAGSNCYGNDPQNCETYGKLYTWAAAMGLDESYNTTKWGGSDFKHQGACPAGWHLPDTGEWKELVEVTDGTYMSSKRLRTTSGWSDTFIGGQGTDDFGFSAKAGGARGLNGEFGLGVYGYWRIATEKDERYAGWISLGTSDPTSGVVSINYKHYTASVRCVADKQPISKPTVTNPALVYNGHEQWAGIPASPLRAYEVIYADAIDAGDYVAIVTLDTANFVWADGTADRVLRLPWSIAPAAGKFIAWETDTTYSPTLKLSDLTLPPGYGWAESTDSTAHLSAGEGQKFAAVFTAHAAEQRHRQLRV